MNPEDIDQDEVFLDDGDMEYEKSIDIDDDTPINQEPLERKRVEIPLDREQTQGIKSVLTAAQASDDPEIQMLGKIGELRLEARLEETKVERELLLPDDESRAKDFADRRRAVAERLKRQNEESSGKAFPVGSNDDITARIERVLNGGEKPDAEPPSLDDDFAKQGASYNENSAERERLRQRLAARKRTGEGKADGTAAGAPTNTAGEAIEVEPPPHRIGGRVNQRNVPPLVRGIKKEESEERE